METDANQVTFTELTATIQDATLEDQVSSVENQAASIESEIEAHREKALSADERILELQRQIKDLQDSKYRASEMIRDAQYRKRRVVNRKFELLGAIEVREENKRKAQQLAAKHAELEQRSEDFKWRTGTKDGWKAYRHQIDGAYFLAEAGRGAILADSMGLGKTGTSLFGCDLAGAKRILIVCPGEIQTGFVKEISRWTDRPAFMLGKQPKAYVRTIFKTRKAANLGAFVDVINYEAWSRDKALLVELESMQYDTIIVDEAHNIKETDTSAFQGVKQIVFSENTCSSCGTFGKKTCFKPGCTGRLDRSVQRVFCMTGTPILNQPGEIYSLLHLIDPAHFHSKASFQREYCVWDYALNKYVFRPGGEASLAERLSGMYLRRTHQSAGIVLPKQDIIVHEIELDADRYPKQAEILKTLAEHAAIEIENTEAINMMSILALITRQRQAATWPGGIVLHETKLDEFGMPVLHPITEKPIKIDIPVGLNFQESVKIDRAVELTEEFVSDGQRIVVFSQFREVLAELGRRFKGSGIRAAEFHGSTPTAERERIKNNFDRDRLARTNESPIWDVVLCHYKTGGVGLNLTAATATIIMDEEWNPGKNQQAYDRTHRMGQTENTSVHILRLAESIDVWMEQLIASKKQLIGQFDMANEEAKKELADMFRRSAGK